MFRKQTMAYKLLIFILFFSVPLQLISQEDLTERPSLPGTYNNGFFAMDARGLSDVNYEAWINPGNDYCRVKIKRNCDGTNATALQVSSAETTWMAMARCNKFRIRLSHDSELKFPHTVIGEKVQVFYTTSIPSSLISDIKSCLDPNTFEFLGVKYSIVCAALNARQAGLCTTSWPSGNMGAVILGWESASE